MSLDRIIELTEVDQISGNDYIHLQSPTLGDRRIKASNLGGAVGVNWFLENKKVASTGGVYITTNLEKELEENSWYIFAFSDPSGAGTTSDYDKINFLHFYSSGNERFSFYGHSDIAFITLTPTTVSLSSYGGSYRDIYCKISKLDTTERIYV